MTEKHEQMALFKRAQFNPITRDYMWASMSGGSRNPIEARNLKLQGNRKGIPDVFLAYPRGSHHGLFIELKRPKKAVVTKEQKEMLQRLENVGYCARVCYGWLSAWELIERYLSLEEMCNL